MVKTRRSVNGDADDRKYRKRTLSKVDDEQDETVDGWSPRELRSHYRVPRKRQHWPPQLVSKRLRTIKMPRIMYPESEDTEPEKFSRRCRPMRVFFEDGDRVRRRGQPRRSNAVDRQLRPLQPNNYMEDSDKPMQEPTSHVRRSGRQRKLLHHTFNESWITNELKVKGYPRLYGIRQMSSSSESSSDDDRTRPTKQMQNKRICEDPGSDEDNSNDKIATKKNINHSSRISVKKEIKTDEERNRGLEDICENGISNADSDKKSDAENAVGKNEKGNSDDGSNDNENIGTMTVSNRSLRLRRGRSGDATEINSRGNRNRGAKKNDIGVNSHSQRETGSDSDNSSDSGSEIVVRRQLRRSNRTRKPRNAYIESQNCEGKQYTMRKKPYTIRKTYSLRERKQPKIIVRSQSPTTSSSSSSSDTEDELNVSVQNKTKVRQKSKTLGEHTDRALRDIQPVELDGSVRFSSVGGLEGHIRCLREMVLFPLMYPQLFQKFGTRPPKGVLFHGPPGTGKTLLARALASECSIQGGQKVSFFMRKGADCLKKWVGESERNIKLLFQQASKMKPSIIFFDEIDALAPVRSVRQEQVHTSVVGTLLAEMDGLCDRGEVVVIGATNRLDAVDPALRRAGRFDRELHFPPPPASQRAAILKVITSNWNPPPLPATIQHLAEITSGYGGSDLKALCSEAVLKALERTYPQVYSTQHALLIDTQKVEVLCEDLVRAMRGLVAAGSRCNPPPARTLFPHLVPLLSSNVESAVAATRKLFPLAEKPVTSDGEECISNTVSHQWSSVLLLRGDCATSHIGPALLSAMEHCAVREISLSALHQGMCLTIEQALLSIFSEVRRCAQADSGCVLYAPSVDVLWPLLGETGSSLLVHQWQELSTVANCLLLATCDCDYDQLPEQVQWLFPSYKDCIHDIKPPTATDVTNFLKPLFLVRPLEPIFLNKLTKLPELPKAPPPPPSLPSALEQRRAARKEAHLLRELRIFLRDVCRKLAANRRFYKFTKPVDLEEVTDYLEIIKEPMDLETMMTKVDMHRYNCARDFLQDIDLICANALEYNPDRTSSDKQIRHEACSLRDHAHALVEVEMDSDFEEDCRAIANRRADEGLTHDKDLPNFIFTAHTQSNGTMSATSCHTLSPPIGKPNGSAVTAALTDTTQTQTAQGSSVEEPSVGPSASQDISSAVRKRKRKKKGSLWSKGIAKKQKTSIGHKDTNNPIITDEDSKENKPICASPVNGEPSPSSVDKSDGEDAQSKSNGESRSPSSRSGGRDRDHSLVGKADTSHTTAARRLQLDSTEMLFDVNAVDLPIPTPKALDSQQSPGKQGDRRSSSVHPHTSTPQRKKSSQGDHSSLDFENKIKINTEELEACLQKSVKAVKGTGLKPLMDLYCQLDRVLNKFKAQHDRSNLPAEMLAVVNKFTYYFLLK